MHIAVVGATGPTGRELVRQALAAGHTVIAAARNPDAANLPAGVKVVKADVTDPASLAALVAGQDAVISSLGSKLSRKPTTLLSGGTTHVVAAMQAVGVRRFVCITGIGAGDSKGHGGFLYDRIIQPLLLNEIYKDKTRQEEVVKKSGLDWTIVRPAMLTNGPRTGSFRVLTNLTGVTASKVSRADVAEYILRSLGDPKTYRSTVLLSY
jgi:putative NADH-flavin reductase